MRIIGKTEAAVVSVAVLALGALILTFASAQTSSISITAGPSVDNIVSSGARVQWTTDIASSSLVYYGTTSNSLTSTSSNRCDGGADTLNHCVYLTSLPVGTIYYRAYSSTGAISGTSTESSFVSTSSGGGSTPPPTPGMPSGSSMATTGTSTSFQAMLYDQMSGGTALNMQMKAVFDWGDGTAVGESSLIYPSTSGTMSPSVSHSFTTVGSYNVKAKAVNSSLYESAWSGNWTVSVAAGGGGVPNPPASVTASFASGYIFVSWPSVTDATHYSIDRSIGGGAYASHSSGASTTNYSDTSVTSGSTYRYRVYACKSGFGCSTTGTESNQITYSSSGGSCTGLILTLDKSSYVVGEYVNYIWTCTPGGNATFVQVQLLKPDATTTVYNSFSGSMPTMSLGFSTSNLVPGSYTLQACFTSNCSPVTVSSTFSVTPTAGGGSPSTPTSLSQVGSSAGSIQLQWLTSSLTNVSSFRLERRTTTSGTWGLVSNTISSTTTSYTDTTVTTGAYYDYRIQACSSTNACSDYFVVYSVVAQAGSTGIPAMPVSFRLEPAPSTTAIFLRWNDVSGEDKYNIEREVANAMSWATLPQLGANAVSYSDSSITAGVVYNYRLQACLSGYGCSGYAYIMGVSTSSTIVNTPTVSNNLPRVIESYPANGISGASTTPAAMFAFDRDVDAASLTATTVLLQQMSGSEPTVAGKGSVVAAVPGSLMYDPVLNRGMATPVSPLLPGTVYQFTLKSGSAGIRTASGLQLDGNGDGTGGDDFVILFKTMSATQVTGTRTVHGRVVGGNGIGVAGAEVYAFDPQVGFGTHAPSGADGGFMFQLPQGSFTLGAHVMGGATSPQLVLVVTGDTLYVGGSSTAVALPNTAAPVIITLEQPDRSISGTVTDGASPVLGASVWAYRTDGPGGASAITDASGSYRLYVSTGTWRISAWLPTYGSLSELTRTVGTSDVTGVNFTTTAQVTHVVSGRVYQDTNSSGTYDAGEGIGSAFVRIWGTTSSGSSFANSAAPADLTGAYSVRVPSGTYQLAGWSTVGELPQSSTFTVAAATTKDLKLGSIRTVTVTVMRAGSPFVVERAFIDFSSTSGGSGNYGELQNASSGTLRLAQGTYTIRAGIPGLGSTGVTFSGTGVSGTTITVGAQNITDLAVHVPAQRRVQVTVVDTQGVVLPHTWVEFMNQAAGVHFGELSDGSGVATLEAPNGDYRIGAFKPGYIGTPTSVTIGDTTTAVTVTLRSASAKISGRVTVPGGNMPRAFVRGERVGELGFAGTPVDTDGTYTLYVSPGSWRLYAIAEGYGEVAYGSAVDVSAASVSNRDIALTTRVTLAPPRFEPVVPAQGGIVQDATTGVTVTIPAQVLGTSTSSGQVQVKETNTVLKTTTALPIGKGVDLTATDSSGKAITNLGGDITIELEYDSASLTAAGATAADAAKLKLAYWDEAAGNWISTNSVVDTVNTTVRANVNHLTVFTIVLPFIATPASAAAPASTPASSERELQLQAILAEAKTARTATAESLAAAVGMSRDTGLEQRYDATIVARVVVAGTLATTRAEVLNFVTYGTATTVKLGAGERAGVVNSYRTAFGRVPASEADWQDVLKIANGRFPGTISTAREAAVVTSFKRIYGRDANRAQANDDAAITVMAYGLRSSSRNLGNEAVAIKSFRAIFGPTPSTAADWDAVRAIAYSGAKR